MVHHGIRDAAEVQVHEPRTVAEHLGSVHRAPCRSRGRIKPVEGRAERSDRRRVWRNLREIHKTRDQESCSCHPWVSNGSAFLYFRV